MNTAEAVSQALSLLDSAAEESSNPPAMVVLPPNSVNFIIGNRDGFIRLAAASLRAEQGEQQSFKGAPWVKIEDLDWGVAGLKPDASAHVYLPSARSRFQRWRSQLLRWIAVLFMGFCVLLGIGMIIEFLFHLARR